jgi:hypothetical protein
MISAVAPENRQLNTMTPITIEHAAAVFKSVDWVIPAYLQSGGIRRLASMIETAGPDAGQQILHIALSHTYNEEFLSSMLLGLYCKTVYVQDFKAQISEAIEASFSGLHHAAIATLIPVLEGVIRKIAKAENRDVGSGTQKLINEFDHMIDAEKRSVHMFEERLVMLKALRDFFADRLLKNTNLYDGFDEFNRHGILHGIFESYGSQINFFRAITLLDLLCFILMPVSQTSVFAPEATTDSTALSEYYHLLGRVSKAAPLRARLEC